MSAPRRLSQAISEGEGISVIVAVADAESARAAESEGAHALAVPTGAAGVREATSLPLLVRVEESLEPALEAGADACLIVVESQDADRLELLHAETERLGLECVVDVRDEDELELALGRIDPHIFLLSPRGANGGEGPIERVLDLLPDVPAGKLAIAELQTTSREEVVALERAGVDAVLVGSGSAAELVRGPPPEV